VIAQDAGTREPIAAVAAPGQAASSTEAVRTFQSYGGRVVKLEVIERDSLTKHSLGTGFFVDASGRLITNYHVISEAVRKPQLYRLEYVIDGVNKPAEVLALDVIHDLAVVSTQESKREGFVLGDVRPDQGTKLYSLGHPHDLGLTIVEGTYNGLLEHRLYEQLHFSGAINAGMSGGPALLPDGRVVGVNVASMGNNLGFLVPIRFASELLERLRKSGPSQLSAMHDAPAAQVLVHQREAFASLKLQAGSQVQLGPYSVPGKIAPFLRCWAENDDEEHLLYTEQKQQCATEDGIYLDDDLTAGTITFRHVYYSSKGLDAIRFASLIEDELESTWSVDSGERSSHTEFRCQESNIGGAGPTARAVMCMRAYRRYRGLYDLVLKVATLDDTQHAVVSMMVANGLSYETSVLLSKSFMEAIKWHH
jgi:serine protease Do